MTTSKKQMLNRHLLFLACEAFHPCGCFISRFLFRKISPYAKRRVRSRCILYICSTSDHFFDGSEMKRKIELILPQLSRHPIIRHQHFFPLHIGMDIDTHRGSHIGMSKQFAYCFHVKSMGNAVCGKNMPQHVKIKGRDPQAFQNSQEPVL